MADLDPTRPDGRLALVTGMTQLACSGGGRSSWRRTFRHPRDHGEVAAFVASPAAAWITGEAMRVDDGTLASPGRLRRCVTRFTNVPRDFVLRDR